MFCAQTSSKATVALIVAALGLVGCKKEASVDPGSATDASADAETEDAATADADADAADETDEGDEVVALNKANFDETVHDHFSEVSDCYVAALEGNPELAGKLDAEFKIGSEGEVISIIAVEGSTLTDAGLLTCINSAASSWSFAKPTDGEMSLRYSFNLEPG